MTTEYTLKESDLNHFTGSQYYYGRPNPLQPFYYTEGVDYVIRYGGAGWLISAIASYQHSPEIRNNEALQAIQFWTLTRQEGNTAQLVCEIDTDQVVIMQKIDYCDFPLPKIRFYLQNMEAYWYSVSIRRQFTKPFHAGVLHLPTEY